MLVVLMLDTCVQVPPIGLKEPSVVSAAEEVDYASVLLKATFDDVAYLKFAGFYLWQNAGEKRRQEAELGEGTTISAVFTGLEAETEYWYTVFFSNGQTESVSEERHFTTAVLPMPTVSEVVVETTESEAAFHVSFSDAGFLRSCGLFYWPEGENGCIQISATLDGSGFDCTLSELMPDSEYRYCVYYSNGMRIAETDPASFRTQPAPTPGPEPEPEPEPEPQPLPPTAFDPALLDYLLGHFDADADGVLTDVELSRVKELDISDLLLDSQTGLEQLTALETLVTGDNWLACFDLSANKHLLSFTGGRSPHLQELILDNPELIQTYIVGAPNLHSLDFTHCPRLYVSQWYDVGLESVDLSENEDLYNLDLSETKLKELDLSGCRRLKILKSESNPELKTIWLKEGIILDTCEVEPHTEIKYK